MGMGEQGHGMAVLRFIISKSIVGIAGTIKVNGQYSSHNWR
jgi:hypothetical protein